MRAGMSGMTLSEDEYEVQAAHAKNVLPAWKLLFRGCVAKLTTLRQQLRAQLITILNQCKVLHLETKFEGLKVSMDLPNQVAGLYHAGSVGIIMSGWLGSMNYGVIVANKLDKWLYEEAKTLAV